MRAWNELTSRLPAGEESDLFDLLDGRLSRIELEELMALCLEARLELVDAEPSPRKAEAHEAWEDRVEDLEDLIDELADRLEG